MRAPSGEAGTGGAPGTGLAPVRAVRQRTARLAALAAGIGMPPAGEAGAWLSAALDAEAKARSAFFLIPIGLIVGIAIVHGAGFAISLPVAGALAAPALALAFHLAGRRFAGALALLAAFVLCGIVLATAELGWTRTTIVSGEATVRIEGRVAWRDRDDRGRMRYRVRIERTERPVLSRPPDTASILVSSRHEPIPVGGRYRGLVRLRAPSGPAYPGAYDFAFGSFFEGRGANGFALGAPDGPDAAAAAAELGWGERLVRLRLSISDRIRAAIPGAAGAVASALITGERSGIPDDVNEWLRASGLSHVLSISGLHMALVAGFAMILVRGVLAAVPGAVLVLPAKKIAAFAALLVATAYLVISGSNVATDRSYIMLSIMLLAIVVDRPALTLRNVGLAAIVVLVMTPHAVATASFQMSFAATTALVGVYGAYAGWRAVRPGSAARARGLPMAALLFLGGLAASSAIAGAATAPYAAYHFQRIAPYGVLANLLALPIFSVWIMPLALIAVVLMPFGLDGPVLTLIGLGLEVVFEIAHRLADALPDAPSGRLTPLGLAMLTAALLLFCLSASRLRWIAVPLALAGLAVAPDRAAPPELLVFEDGREVATIDEHGALHAVRERPNDFVFAQWERAFAGRAAGGETPKASPQGIATAFACMPTPIPPDPAKAPPSRTEPTAAGRGDAEPAVRPAAVARPEPQRRICRATTRSGLRIVWTDDYRMAGLACDSADVAIVARAIVLERCRSGARLVTLRTLRRSGSLAISRQGVGDAAAITPSITEPVEAWNRHRLAPWPEYWRNPRPADPAAGTAIEAQAGDAPSAGIPITPSPTESADDAARSRENGLPQTVPASTPLSTSGSARPAGPGP